MPAGAALPGKYLGVTHRLFRVRKARAEMSAGLAVSSDAPVEQSNGTLVDSAYDHLVVADFASTDFTAPWMNYLYADAPYFQTNNSHSLAKTLVMMSALNLMMIVLLRLMSPSTLIWLKNLVSSAAASFQMFRRWINMFR